MPWIGAEPNDGDTGRHGERLCARVYEPDLLACVHRLVLEPSHEVSQAGAYAIGSNSAVELAFVATLEERELGMGCIVLVLKARRGRIGGHGGGGSREAEGLHGGQHLAKLLQSHGAGPQDEPAEREKGAGSSRSRTAALRQPRSIPSRASLRRRRVHTARDPGV